ncbi:11074_t:CDS:2 [Funneliformis geosporum]|nr:11074_t:CDS:2 [Funneliformis geosporum]
MTKITLHRVIRSLGTCGFFKIEIEKNEHIVDLKEIIMKKYYKSFSDNNFYEASAVRIILNGEEEQYESEKIENTFGNPPKNYYNLSLKRGLDRSFKLHEISDFHINNVNNENAGENGPEYRNEDEGDSSPTEFKFVGNLKNIHKYIDMDESDYNNVIEPFIMSTELDENIRNIECITKEKVASVEAHPSGRAQSFTADACAGESPTDIQANVIREIRPRPLPTPLMDNKDGMKEYLINFIKVSLVLKPVLRADFVNMWTKVIQNKN